MFQAIKTLNHLFPFVFFCFLSILQLSADPMPKKDCSLLDPGVPSEYLLSRAIKEQITAYKANNAKKMDVAKESFEASISLLDNYHLCQKEKGKKPSSLSAELQAQNYLELGDTTKAWEWSEIAKTEATEITKEIVILQMRVRLREQNLVKATEVLEKDLVHFPNDPDFLYLLGNLYFERKMWNQSLLYYTALSFVIERRDTSSKYKYITAKALGDLNYKLDYPKISIKHFNEYNSVYKNDMEVLFRLAQIYFVLGDFKLSKFYLEQIREKNPRDIDASHMLAEIYFLNARDVASQFFHTLSREKKIPKDGLITLLYQLVNGSAVGLEEKLKNFINANPARLTPRVALLELAEKNNSPSYHQFNAETAQYAYEYRQYVLALTILKKGYQKLDPMSGETELRVAYLEKISACQEMLGQWNHSILSMKEALSLSTDLDKNLKMRFRLAYLYLQGNLKKEETSVGILSNTLQENPNPTHFYLRGLSYFQLGKYQESVKDYSQAIQMDPNNPNFYFYRASAYDKLKQFEETESDLKKTISLNPNASNAMNYLGYLYAEKDKHPEEANSLLNKAISLEPDNPAYQDSLGWVYYRKKEFNLALLHLNFAASLALERGFEDPVIYEHLGDVYLAKKDPVNAIQFYKLSLARDKQSTNKDLVSKIKRVEKEISQ
ncbi:tetratricopeptide repeat protein [Leptospira yanagawae]|uniref:Tetratricopeptide repeat protein n=1 Tax=Leptospira yanagawae TaxID=293069 RepID=A0ABY2LWZ9_9LEPT|nr:tetratricopeptide repeat protein [Leptospira yanagawae]TGL17040.1 tetratricopeptide repeat protein [Leptospira yanagawae]